MREIKENTMYRHFLGHTVKVIYLATDSKTLKPCVVYEEEGKIWVRDYDDFVSEVDKLQYPETEAVYAFTEA